VIASKGSRRAGQGIRLFFRELRNAWETSRFHVEDLRAVRGRVLASFVLTTRGRMSEAETAIQLVGVYGVEGGKIRRARIFLDRAEPSKPPGSGTDESQVCGRRRPPLRVASVRVTTS
jgi:hypothetical protein